MQRLKKFLHAEYLYSSSTVMASFFAVAVLNYVFTLAMARLLPPASFGEITALFSLLVIISVPTTAIVTFMAKQVSFYRAHNDDTRIGELFEHLNKNVILGSLLLWVLFLLFVPVLSGYLDIPRMPMYVFSLSVPVSLLASVSTGFLQGAQEFWVFSFQTLLGAIVKLVLSIAFVMLGFSVTSVMVALLLATGASLAYGYFKVEKILHQKKQNLPNEISEKELTPRYAFFSSILAASLLLALLSNIDVLVAKHFLSADLAGQYAALSTIGKLFVYGIGTFATVLLPMVSAARAEGGGKEKKFLLLAVSITTLVSLVVYAVFSLAPNFVVAVLFGHKYFAIAPYLGIFTIAMYFVSIATLLVNYFIGIQNRSFIFFFGAGIVTEIALLGYYHASVGQMAWALMLSSIVITAFLSVNYFFCLNRKLEKSL